MTRQRIRFCATSGACCLGFGAVFFLLGWAPVERPVLAAVTLRRSFAQN